MEMDRIFPDNWKDVIRGKKVILYNTGVTSLLRERETRIEKMKWVFDIFKEHPEVVLWWRPHPLEMSTAHSMLPELEEQYMKVRRQFVEEGIGILDESADLNRAIAISDAYYGAWSSVAGLYKAAKKPVLFEINRIRREEEPSFLPAVLCIKDEFIWFIQLNSNKLVKVDKKTFEVEKVINIPFESPYRDCRYNYHLIDAGNSLLLLLENSRQIYEYEFGTGTIKSHRPECEGFIFHSEIVMKRGEKLVMLPYNGNSIVEYDYCAKKTIKKTFMQHNIKAARCCEVIGTKVYMVDKNSNILYQYDTRDDSYTTKTIGEQDNRYWGAKKAGRYFVLPHQEKPAITLWDEESGETIELTKFPQQYTCYEELAYLDMIESDGNIYIFPLYANMILKVDVENKQIVQGFESIFLNVDYSANSERISEEIYLCVKKYGNYIYAYAAFKKCWQIFDFTAMCVQDIPFAGIKKREHKDMIENILNDEVYEESFCQGEHLSITTLKNYIKNVADHQSEGAKKAENGGIGGNIYRKIIQ